MPTQLQLCLVSRPFAVLISKTARDQSVWKKRKGALRRELPGLVTIWKETRCGEVTLEVLGVGRKCL